jgi:hypothetical protein
MTPGNAVQADPVEERGASLYRIVHLKHGGTLKPESVSTKQERIAELAKNNPAMALTTLAHHIDYEWVKYAYDCTRKDGAVGCVLSKIASPCHMPWKRRAITSSRRARARRRSARKAS